jgi:hypothetical protein
MEFLTNNLNLLAGGGASALVLWVLKKIPNDDIKAWVGTGAYWAGKVITLNLSSWKWTKGIWQKTVEPYIIDLVDNVAGEAVKQFIKGLRSDN